jgi:hypothetical protein
VCTLLGTLKVLVTLTHVSNRGVFFKEPRYELQIMEKKSSVSVTVDLFWSSFHEKTAIWLTELGTSI